MKRSFRPMCLTAAFLSVGLTLVSAPAGAEDFFSALFRAFGGRQQAPRYDQGGPFGYSGDPRQLSPRQADTGGPAYCVRSCDGRYFPAPPVADQSRAEACKNFCPAAETSVFYGRNIDGAVNDKGKAYSQLPNAFKFRSELVAGCSCNGKDPVGLASVKIEDDKTLRRGDIVASADTPDVAGKPGQAGQRGVSMNFSPAQPTTRPRYQRVPMFAQF